MLLLHKLKFFYIVNESLIIVNVDLITLASFLRFSLIFENNFFLNKFIC